MSPAPPPAWRLDDWRRDFRERFARLGRELGEREQQHAADIARARDCADAIRADVAVALEEFHRAAAAVGAPHLAVQLGEVRTDDKHLRAVEFELVRGRNRAIITAKSRGDVTLVGPFHRGKAEGPCRSFRFEAEAEIRAELADFLAKFLEDAATP